MESALHRGKPPVLRQRFNGLNPSARDRGGEREAGKPWHVIDQHRAGTALPAIATGLGAVSPTTSRR